MCRNLFWIISLLAVIVGCSGEEARTGPSAGDAPTPAGSPSPMQVPGTATDPGPAGSAVENGWSSVTALDGRVSVSFPGPPRQQEQTVQSSRGPVRVIVYKAQWNGVFWNLLITSYPPAVMAAAFIGEPP